LFADRGHESRQARDVSVVICAYTERRWGDISAAVRSVTDQTVRPLEVIVVCDHNSELLERVRVEMPDVVALANEEQRGLSGARNTGVRTATGEIVAFLDDDATAAPDWLESLLEPYEDASVMGVGGAVEPLWPDARPPLFPTEFDWVVGCSYRGLPAARSPVRNPIGANMSLRHEVFTMVGGFLTDVGRVGRRPLGCEETELCIRVRRRIPGSVILYEPRARVRHRVTDERLRWSYFRARCYSEGLSKAVVARHAGWQAGLASERTYATRTLPQGVARGLADAVLRGDARGLARAGTIIAGLGFTTLGYTVGRLRRFTPEPSMEPSPSLRHTRATEAANA
jgi:glycosyltransferase involved in cell wall biosynthesis